MHAELTVEERDHLVLAGLEDPAFFCRTFFPEWFPLPMPWAHRGILALLCKQTDWLLKFGEEEWPKALGVWDESGLDKICRHFVWRKEPEDAHSPQIPLFTVERDSSGRPAAIHLGVTNKMLIIAPRGFSKTTLINAMNIRKIVYHDTDFLVYLSETGPHSKQQLENVSRELESNAKLISVFGYKVPGRSDPERWTDDLIETTDGVVVTAKGRGGQVRGLNHRGKRPQDIIFDDVEDKESVLTPEQRDKCRTWLKADVEPALPQIESSRPGRMIGLGTIIHSDSLLVNLSRDPEWVTVQFGAIDADGDMLWDHYMTRLDFERKKRSFVRLGKIAEFNMEYLSSVRGDGEGSKFPGPFRYTPEAEWRKFPVRAIVCDPAISDKKDSDFCAFGVVGMSDRGKICVLDIFMERGMQPRAQVDKFFELHFLWDCNRHGVEAIAYQQALIHLLQEEMFRLGKTWGPRAYFEIEPIKHGKTGKVPRVEGILAPRYSAGYITHFRRFPDYEEQLLDWPNAKKDGPDVIAMAVQLLDPYAGYAFDPESDDEDRLARDMFEPLDDLYLPGVAGAP